MNLKKVGLLISLMGFISLSIGLFVPFTSYFAPKAPVENLIARLILILLSCFLIFLGMVMFFELPKQEITIKKDKIIIKTKFFRAKERRIPLSSVLRVYVNLDMSYKYYIRQSKTSEMLKTIVIFEKDGLRIMTFLDQNSITNFNEFVEKLIAAGIKVIKIPLDIRSQKEFVEKTLHNEYLQCNKIE